MAEQVPTGGAAAIAGTPPTGKTARRQLKRLPNGKMGVVLIDAATGQELPNGAPGYNIVESSNYTDLDQLGLDPTKSGPDEKTTAEAVNEQVRREPHESSNTGESSKGAPRTASNNFGYIDKPGWASFAGALPGALGLAGKAVNAGINANNNAAAQSARGMLGLEAQSNWDQTKNIARDNKGQVADVNINNNTYKVGFEALSPNGQTNLTPNEARSRGLALGGIKQATPDQIKSNTDDFENQGNRGFFSSMLDGARSFVNDLFGGEKLNPGMTKNSFPEAPSRSGGSDFSFATPSPNANMSMKDQYASYGAGKAGGGIASGNDKSRDFSDTKAQKEIDKGYSGGLY